MNIMRDAQCHWNLYYTGITYDDSNYRNDTSLSRIGGILSFTICI